METDENTLSSSVLTKRLRGSDDDDEDGEGISIKEYETENRGNDLFRRETSQIQIQTALSLADAGSENVLKLYYEKFFPGREMYRWLAHGDAKAFRLREFSFTLDDSIYLRYKSFKNVDEFMQELKKYNPSKIDIGAEFSAPPKDHNSIDQAAFLPKFKEFVVDIDVSDYEDIWSCGVGVLRGDEGNGALTLSEWPFMSCSIRCLDHILRECFGFDHIMWVYSGRRGVHGWICDPQAMAMSSDERSAVADFLQVYMGGGDNIRRRAHLGANLRIHPVFRYLYTKVVRPTFLQMAEQQEWFSRPAAVSYLLSILPERSENSGLRQEIEAIFRTIHDAEEAWSEIEYLCSGNKYDTIPLEIAFVCVYPRLDINVSKGLNHLLKSPFSVHPKTGRVCVPICISPAEVEVVDTFDPTRVPTARDLIREYEALNLTEIEMSDSDVSMFRTSIGPSIRLFQEFASQRREAANVVSSVLKKDFRDDSSRIKQEAADWNVQ